MITIRRDTPAADSTFCDDIRQEVGGKSTLVGVYGNEMVFQGPLPAWLPKLCVRTIYMERPGQEREPVHIKVFLPGDPVHAPTINSKIDVEQVRAVASRQNLPNEVVEEFRRLGDEPDPMIAIPITVMMGPVEIKQTGLARVIVSCGERNYRAGGLWIKSEPEALEGKGG